MPILTIKELFIHNGTDLNEYRKFLWSTSEGADTGEQNTMLSAAGEAIVVDSPGKITTFQWSLRGISLDDWAWLRRFRGEFVLIRDSRGVREYGSYITLSWTQWPNPPIIDTAIALTALGFDETK